MSLLKDKRFGFIGGGRMAEAIMTGLLCSDKVERENILVTDLSADRLNALKQRLGVTTLANDAGSNAGAIRLAGECDILVLAVKPQYLRPVLEAAGGACPSDGTVISIVGGAPLALLEEFIFAPVVRVMPNTPMLVQEGAAGIALGKRCEERHGALAMELFGLMGIAYLLPEGLIDPVTSVSGCGPAYAYLMIEAMADGGVKMGLPRETAQALAAQTLLGAAKMVLQGGHPGQLKDNVCSPGGSTIAGVHALEQGGFRGTVMDAVEAAMAKMEEVGKKI